jgi:hypothetical protein
MSGPNSKRTDVNATMRLYNWIGKPDLNARERLLTTLPPDRVSPRPLKLARTLGISPARAATPHRSNTPIQPGYQNAPRTRQVRAPGLQHRLLVKGVGWAPSPGVPISSIVRIAANPGL